MQIFEFSILAAGYMPSLTNYKKEYNVESQGKSCEFRSKADDDDWEEVLVVLPVVAEYVPL